MTPKIGAVALKARVRPRMHDHIEIAWHPAGFGTGHTSPCHPQGHPVLHAHRNGHRQGFGFLHLAATVAQRAHLLNLLAATVADRAGADLLH